MKYHLFWRRLRKERFTKKEKKHHLHRNLEECLFVPSVTSKGSKSGLAMWFFPRFKLHVARKPSEKHARFSCLKFHENSTKKPAMPQQASHIIIGQMPFRASFWLVV